MLRIYHEEACPARLGNGGCFVLSRRLSYRLRYRRRFVRHRSSSFPLVALGLSAPFGDIAPSKVVNPFLCRFSLSRAATYWFYRRPNRGASRIGFGGLKYSMETCGQLASVSAGCLLLEAVIDFQVALAMAAGLMLVIPCCAS